jgi:hypothetical protein
VYFILTHVDEQDLDIAGSVDASRYRPELKQIFAYRLEKLLPRRAVQLCRILRLKKDRHAVVNAAGELCRLRSQSACKRGEVLPAWIGRSGIGRRQDRLPRPRRL